MIRRLTLSIVLLVIAIPVLAGVPDSVDPAQIPNYRAIRPDLAFGGQPSPEALEKLSRMGFRTVVNLRTEGEGAVQEGEVVRGLGLRYVWVPVTPGTFSLDDVTAVERVLDDPESGPVLLHCASSNRVAAVWAAILMRDGRTVEEAETEARATGLHSPSLWDAVLRVLDRVPFGVNP